MPEAPEMEVTPMLEEIATRNAAMFEIAAAFEMPVTIEIVIPISAVVQRPVAVPVAETVAILVKVRAAGFV